MNYVAEGSITTEEYMVKLENFIKSRTSGVLRLNNQYALREYFQKAASYYKTPAKQTTGKAKSKKKESKAPEA